ncbi:hypothetical protein [Pseudobdellovibrio exovorus]|uniref:Uncharacterized protein n=1 Tax=Pseudobdellovibrio exovorus JSS TaxID=1184267 RepID=M4VRX4_9BACT|nr:hypothetical protein [Pseudobdellovibrio exovorus]AGH95934.1 hypothetical protein A11Q_1718 [Pseudobdellovibrio exovorus JSS]
MKTVIAFLMLSISINAAAGTLVCKGFETKTVLSYNETYSDESGTVAEIWDREYEKAQYADLFNAFISNKTVEQLIEKGVIRGNASNAKFKLDLNKNTLEVTTRGTTIKDIVKCEYR